MKSEPPKIIGREPECHILEQCYRSPKAEFIAVHGRRRVGKTYLLREYFAKKKDCVFLKVTGMQQGTMTEQIANFMESVAEAFLYPGARLEPGKNWREAFKILTDNIKISAPNKKIVLFFDEFPWMATKNSKLLQFLEYFWNHHWSADARIKLIVCGSVSSWIIKNIINNKKGLYNRVTRSIHLEPFNLYNTKKFLAYRGLKLSNKQVAELYMALGGIPHYLEKIERGLSCAQIIEHLAFRKKSFFLTEFETLYASLFDDPATTIEIVRTIAKHVYGIGQEELARKLKSISSGGTLVKRLEDLASAGFIMSFKPHQHKKKGLYYKVIDEYSLFYFQWIESVKSTLLGKGLKPGYWDKIKVMPAYRSWAGYAFESLCYKHLVQISEALHLSPTAIPNTWRFSPKANSKESGAQIDLLFDRDDGVINLCDMKYKDTAFIIDKKYAADINRKIEVFKEKTRTEKQILFSIISANGLKETMYSEEMIDGIVTLDDLFKPES
jgi:AAA+ ATPase superfamily predicted ATPase